MPSPASAIKRVGPVTVTVEEPKGATDTRPSQSAVYRNVSGVDGLVTTFNGLSTPYEIFADSVKRYPDRKCLGWRPIDENGVVGDYLYHTYKETDELAGHVASGLGALGVREKSKVGVWSVNCVPWMLCIRGSERLGAVIVPMYDSLGETAIEYIARHSELEVAVVQKDKMELMAQVCEKGIKTLKGCIVIGDVDPKIEARMNKCGLFVHSWDAVVQMGRDAPVEASPPGAEDVACIMYTSGTSGTPKGVIIHHRALVSGVASAHDMIKQTNLGISEDDSLLSYMPLAHIFDRLLEEFALSVGASIGYWQGNVKKLMDDVAAFKPSLFMAVPRILERVCDGVNAELAKGSPVIRKVFNGAFAWKKTLLHWGMSHSFSGLLTDRTVFGKLKNLLGGRVRFIVSGGAPLPAHVEEFCTVCLAPVLQGYGLTESCAASFIMLPDPRMAYTVGPPLCSTELRFESVPDLEYDALSSPPQGEILLRSPMLFSGYLKDEEKTKEAIDEDGWFHTGDVGTITDQGCLKVIDRVKNMFKLSQGEYIAVEHLESVYSRCEHVEQIWVHGSSTESSLVCVVVPTKSWRASIGDVSTPEAADEMLKQLVQTGKQARLKGYEMVKAIHLTTEEFTVENDLLTPTFKPKRNQLQKKYQKEIESMYSSLKK
jgi:long-chain acyl-CoA synthetase